MRRLVRPSVWRVPGLAPLTVRLKPMATLTVRQKPDPTYAGWDPFDSLPNLPAAGRQLEARRLEMGSRVRHGAESHLDSRFATILWTTPQARAAGPPSAGARSDCALLERTIAVGAARACPAV
jgi:hypothetical protein